MRREPLGYRDCERIAGIPRRDFCPTRETLSSPWLLFEARAISKHRESGHVCTYLIGLTSNDVEEPLSQFQHTRAHKEATLQLLQTINSLLDIPLGIDRLERAFDRKWPKLEQVIENLPSTESDQTPIRASADFSRSAGVGQSAFKRTSTN